jgi:signal transduction histidine kinase
MPCPDLLLFSIIDLYLVGVSTAISLLAISVGLTTYLSSKLRKQKRRLDELLNERQRGKSLHDAERLDTDAALKASNEQLRALSSRLQTIREEETTRISREIHDVLGSALTGLKWDLEFLDRKLSDPAGTVDLQAITKDVKGLTRLVDTTIGNLRRISSELRPGVLDDLGLDAAIEWEARQFQVRTGIVCEYDSNGEIELSRTQSIEVFRILQEALTNVIRHASATRVAIDMKADGAAMSLTISDNGRGIKESQKSGQHAIGILGMQERAHLIGGKIDIQGTTGKGTVVTLQAPLFQMESVTKSDGDASASRNFFEKRNQDA